ncbi:CpsD/CapB family tyrosine-protein kinase [Petroclostridium sp. X23]|uniref:CpsD/CapB family tyrosine-protein kinase n=1 Tax=Petroclostridium sp. X23 TaxID=3045146 RepID=UPI0024AD01EB|nr:CpsD/CapB family tyrosine-protein kinase [Petroclostridium sp. X23]WHH57517.1 CpsD/CapB family tyrosine-protein kinase [Petroclostridium sp. X23]
MIKERCTIRTDTKANIIETYRMLQASVDAMIHDKKIKVIAFTGLIDGKGKTKHACNIAISMAQEGKKILLMDCDIKNPKVHEFFEVSNDNGLTRLKAAADYQQAVFKFSELPTLHVLTSGPKVENPQYTLDTARIEVFLDTIKEAYDLILIDAPPAGQVAEGVKLSAAADGTVLVMAVGKTPVATAVRVKEILDTVKASILGVILEK